jgi:glycosyltransferase involved in cell wall biosynthesis
MDRNLLVLSVYGEDQAGTRLRACQYEPALRAAGFDVTYWTFLSASDSRRWFGDDCPQLLRGLMLVRSVLRLLLLPRLLRSADAVLVLREAVPLATTVVERFASRHAVLIWDVDDAIWTDYPRLFATWLPRRLRRTAHKYEIVAGLADEVWAGSELLASWCAQHAGHVVTIPTVVDVPPRVPARAERSRSLGWVGSASTAPFLAEAVHSLALLDAPTELRCVGADVAGAGQVRVVCTPWTPAAEDDVLARARVGLYPLSIDHPLAAGKAGLKAILYMAHGLPCVLTPTETTAAIVRHGVDGLHASTPQEWRDAVTRLLDDDRLWDRMSAASHRRAAEEFSLQTWAPTIVERVRQLCEAAV